MSPFPWRASAVLVACSVLAVPSIATGATCWQPPVTAPVDDPFRTPTCVWCAGNRGIEFDTRRGARVRAVATGRVTFAGPVAGTVYVVVRHGDGRRVTYGNLLDASFAVGDVVVRGQMVGRAAGRFHFGLRDGDRYVDPAPLLGRVVFRPRLIPIDHTPRIPTSPRLSCRR
jgi:murein DD-endopeptidase MepM/ murein hydrolase activator NlpD